MIGKIVSEAANSIIGMLSAKPLDMTHKASTSDFGSLMRSPEEQPQTRADGIEIEIDTSDIESVRADTENGGTEEIDTVADQNWVAVKVPSFDSQKIGNKITFNRDMMIDADVPGTDSALDSTGNVKVQLATSGTTSDMLSPQAQVQPTSSGTTSDMLPHQSQVQQSSSGITSEILSPQSNVTLGNVSQIGIARTVRAPEAVDNQPTDGKLQSTKTGDPGTQPQIPSQLRSNTAGSENFSSDSGQVKRQALEPKINDTIGDAAISTAKKSDSLELQNAVERLNERASKMEASNPAPVVGPTAKLDREQQKPQSELGRFGFRSSPSLQSSAPLPAPLQAQSLAPSRVSSQGPLPIDASDVLKTVGVDGKAVEPSKSELQQANKSAKSSFELQPVANAVPQLAVRETTQKPVSFNMSAPQVAERLAAEISDISVTGGVKSFEINPRNLGRMEIIFTTRGSLEIVEIQTEFRAAKDIIVQHSQVLQDILKSQGRDDLTLRVDVKENMMSSSKNDGGSLAQQENRDAREQQSMASNRQQMAPSFDPATEDDPVSDISRYA